MKLVSGRSIQPGDIFYIPGMNKEGDYGFVLARYIELIPTNVGHLIEVFAKFYTIPPTSIEDVDKTHRLFRPIMFDMYFQRIPKWKVLFSDPGYDKSQSDYTNIGIAFHTNLWLGGNCKPATREQLNKFEASECWRTHHIMLRVNAHLSGLFGPEEEYDYSRIPKGQRVDDPGVVEKVIAVAEEIDGRFKIWAARKKTK